MRGGVVNCVLVTASLQGWRQARISTQRTRIDWAHCVRDLVDVHFPGAERIVLVLDQLNVYSPALRSQAFPPAEAKHIADNLEIHHTPKNASWLNMAEIELSVLQYQCLNQRFATQARTETAVAAWMTARNATAPRINWQFTTAEARIELCRLYPAFEM